MLVKIQVVQIWVCRWVGLRRCGGQGGSPPAPLHQHHGVHVVLNELVKMIVEGDIQSCAASLWAFSASGLLSQMATTSA